MAWHRHTFTPYSQCNLLLVYHASVGSRSNIYITPLHWSQSVQMLQFHVPADLIKNIWKGLQQRNSISFRVSQRIQTFSSGLCLSMWSGSSVNPGVSPLPNPLCDLALKLRQTLASSLWPGFSWHVRTSLMALPGGLHHSWWFWSISTLTTPRQLVGEQTNM